MTTEHCQDHSSDDHQHGLDEVRPDDCRQPTGHGEDAGDGKKDEDGDVDRSVALKARGLCNEQGPGIQVSLSNIRLSEESEDY